MSALVSSHALARYLERVVGVDVEAYGSSFTAMHFAGHDVNGARQRLEEIAALARAIGASTVIRDGFEFKLVGGVMVTVTPRRRKGIGAAGKGKRIKAASVKLRRGPVAVMQREERL